MADSGIDDSALAALFPCGGVVVASGRVVDTEPWSNEEAAAVERATAARRREFLTGRWTAREALHRAGLPVTEIRRGARGAPQWPGGVVGSITHAGGWCAAVVAREGDVLGVGVDATPDAPITDPAVRRRIVAPAERDGGGPVGPDPATVTFAAKEAVFKAVYPRWGRWLEHHDLWLDLGAGRFTVRRGLDGLDASVDGRWACHRGFVLAGCTISTPA